MDVGIQMPLNTTIKRKKTSLADDIILLETCLDNIDCLAHLRNHCYKSLFWKTVTDTVNQKSENFKNIRQVRDRFKRIYLYYTKIKDKHQCLLTNPSDQKELWFFQKMHECFTRVYYNESGILSLISNTVAKSHKDEWWWNFSMEDTNALTWKESNEKTDLVFYMCEINEKGTYQTAAEMIYHFNCEKKK